MSTVQMQKLIELMETAEMGNDIRARARALNKELAKSGWTDGKIRHGTTGSTVSVPGIMYDPEMVGGAQEEQKATALARQYALQVESIAKKYGATVKITKIKNEVWPRTTGYTLKIVCVLK